MRARLVFLAVVLGLSACKSSKITRSQELLVALHEALRKGDREAWDALSVAARADFDTLCAGSEHPAASSREELRDRHGLKFEQCYAMGPWARAQRGLRDFPDHDGVNRDDRVCGEKEDADCPGLVRLCKSELFAYDPEGEADLKINVRGAHRLPDFSLVLVAPPTCYRKDLRD